MKWLKAALPPGGNTMFITHCCDWANKAIAISIIAVIFRERHADRNAHNARSLMWFRNLLYALCAARQRRFKVFFCSPTENDIVITTVRQWKKRNYNAIRLQFVVAGNIISGITARQLTSRSSFVLFIVFFIVAREGKRKEFIIILTSHASKIRHKRPSCSERGYYF